MNNYTALEDLSHDPKLAEALGNMVVAWAHAEIMVFCTFARATEIGLNMAMESYYRIPTFESRIKFIRALLSEWNTAKFDKDQIDIAVKKLSKLASARNHWVHGDWCIDKTKTKTVIFDHRATPEAKARRKPVKTADVVNHCKAVKKRAAALGKLVDWESLRA
jgi:hypothetical protein